MFGIAGETGIIWITAVGAKMTMDYCADSKGLHEIYEVVWVKYRYGRGIPYACHLLFVNHCPAPGGTIMPLETVISQSVNTDGS